MNCMRGLQIWKRGLLNLPRYAGDLWAVEVWNVILRILIKTKHVEKGRLQTTHDDGGGGDDDAYDDDDDNDDGNDDNGDDDDNDDDDDDDDDDDCDDK